ncbi:hypothetical protein [Gordonia sp. (in: high G+C Gram-positive bacteria)]|uniref:hypothetical protein n=1 Tax=unclassified Gordonia (in: high G+C Gram-positive bacteria) TaxID=2657482 RepID=UPI0026235FD3|nr:hypothetical protein [Gordonia sp. (in: high G+C Gram-positive bacteria)]
MIYHLERRPFATDSALPDIDLDVPETRLATAIVDVLADFGTSTDEDDQEYLILRQADNGARRIGRWNVDTVQAAGSGGEFVLEFLIVDESGDPYSRRAMRLVRPDTPDYDPENPDLFDRHAVACLLSCFAQARDLSDRYQIVQSWPVDD